MARINIVRLHIACTAILTARTCSLCATSLGALPQGNCLCSPADHNAICKTAPTYADCDAHHIRWRLTRGCKARMVAHIGRMVRPPEGREMTAKKCPQGWGAEMCAFAHDHATQLAVDAMVDELVREHVQDLERSGAYGQPFPGEPDRAIEDDWFTYDVGSRPVALGDVVQIGPGCFRARGFGGAE